MRTGLHKFEIYDEDDTIVPIIEVGYFGNWYQKIQYNRYKPLKYILYTDDQQKSQFGGKNS